jgi:hypothetical protein
MLRPVYRKPVNRKPACRRCLFPPGLNWSDREPIGSFACLRQLCTWLNAELGSCAECSPGRLSRKDLVEMCPLPTMQTKDSLRSTSGSSAGPSKTFDCFPELWAFLTSTVGPDGAPRLPGRVSLCWDAGLWTFSLNDPTTGLYASLTAQVLDDLILMAEARLSESTVPWKLSKWAPRAKK